MGVPYVGSGVLASAVGMDKLAMKAAFAAHRLPQVAYEPVTSRGWRTAPEEVRARLARLGYPLFVKPANLGSSIGISRVADAAGLEEALAAALAHDRRVIVEAAAVGARELEVAVLGNDAPAASPVGEVKYTSAFYDYEAKYSDGLAELCVPADVPEAVTNACREAALRAFTAIDARGLARVDFFYLPDSGALLLNEINTMPGFTPHSMYPRLWAQAGVAFPELVRRLLALALEPG
jgi:D-alanine-D-alanine ligase